MSAKIPTDPAELMEFLRAETAERRNNTRWILWCAWGGFGFLFLLQVINWVRSGRPPDFFNFTPALVLFGAASGVSGKHRKAAELAAQMDDPAFSPYMVEVLDCGEPEIKRTAAESLKRSLPRLTDTHRQLFDLRQQKLLATEAMTSTDVDLAEISLNALAGVGGADVLPTLDLIGSGRHAVKGEPGGRVITAAKMAASDIRIRAAAKVIGAAESASKVNLEAEESRLDLRG